MAEAAGVPPTRLMADFAALAIGPGRVDFSDYERLRLFDEAFWGAAADRRSVVGARRARELALARQLPPRLLRPGQRPPGLQRLSGRARPAGRRRSWRSTAPAWRRRARPDAHPRRTARVPGRSRRRAADGAAGRGRRAAPALRCGLRCAAAEIERLMDEVRDAGQVSWLIQPRLAPHPDAAPGDGQRLAPVPAAGGGRRTRADRAARPLAARRPRRHRRPARSARPARRWRVFPGAGAASSPGRAARLRRPRLAAAEGDGGRGDAADGPVRPDRLGHSADHRRPGDCRPRADARRGVAPTRRPATACSTPGSKTSSPTAAASPRNTGASASNLTLPRRVDAAHARR